MSEIRVVAEDEWLCVVDKPAGVVVNDADSVKDVTVQQWFAAKIKPQDLQQKAGMTDDELEFVQKGGVVHRLDKDTSGLLVLAKTAAAYASLKNQFVERQVHKVYLALIHGHFKEEAGVISLPIERHSVNKHKFAVGTDPSRTAITEYKVNQSLKDFQLVELRLHTGRTHQIRVHMKHFGHPLVSDPIYGGKLYKQDITWCPRLFLHATRLELQHPQTGELSVYESPLPSDLEDALRRITVY